MATQYGSKVGAVTLSYASTPLVSPALKGASDQVLIRDTCEVAAAAGDFVSLGHFDWEVILNPMSTFYFDDLGTGCTLSIGDATYATALCSAQDVATAAGSALVMRSVDIANYFKPLWQILGHASLAVAKAIAADCELLAKINTAAAAGTLTWQITGRKA